MSQHHEHQLGQSGASHPPRSAARHDVLVFFAGFVFLLGEDDEGKKGHVQKFMFNETSAIQKICLICLSIMDIMNIHES